LPEIDARGPSAVTGLKIAQLAQATILFDGALTEQDEVRITFKFNFVRFPTSLGSINI
jgi:hypothetical protein